MRRPCDVAKSVLCAVLLINVMTNQFYRYTCIILYNIDIKNMKKIPSVGVRILHIHNGHVSCIP